MRGDKSRELLKGGKNSLKQQWTGFCQFQDTRLVTEKNTGVDRFKNKSKNTLRSDFVKNVTFWEVPRLARSSFWYE
jgi:hypothetical protein